LAFRPRPRRWARIERGLRTPPGIGDHGDGVVAPGPPSSRPSCPSTLAASKLFTPRRPGRP
jgi:hypothetical protein